MLPRKNIRTSKKSIKSKTKRLRKKVSRSMTNWMTRKMMRSLIRMPLSILADLNALAVPFAILSLPI